MPLSGSCRTTWEGAWPGRLVDLQEAEVGRDLDPVDQLAVGRDDPLDQRFVVLVRDSA